jgi:outer membrane lipoprotein LolB
MREAQKLILDARIFRITILASLFVAACSTTPRAPVAPRAAHSLSSWQASGRIAVSGAEAGGSGSFNWSQRDEIATVRMRGPVGIGSLNLSLTDKSMKIATADGEEFLAEEADAELTRRLGAHVPAQSLRYWLVGIAAPGESTWNEPTPESATLSQNHWRIDYQKFAMFDGVRLPTKLVASSGPAKVRIVIDKWKVN